MFNYPASFMSIGGHATNLSFPNMAYSGVLPTMYTNYGGDLQVTNIDPYGGYNLGIMFNPIAQQTWGFPSIFANAGMSAPADVTAAATQRAQSLLTPVYNNMASSNINQASQAIQSTVAKLEAKLAAEDTTDEEKTQIQETLDKLRSEGKTIVTTNGCFDILHAGHVRYLNKAKTFGDVLVVALNSDKSVRTIKGPDRPINNELNRAEVLCGLRSVDYVVLFDENSPLELLKFIKPDVHTKGADYTIETLPEAKAIIEAGGRIEFIPFVEGKSTTGVIRSILKIQR